MWHIRPAASTSKAHEVLAIAGQKPLSRTGFNDGPGSGEQPRRRGQQSADVQTWGQPLAPGTAGGGRNDYQAAPGRHARASRRTTGSGALRHRRGVAQGLAVTGPGSLQEADTVRLEVASNCRRALAKATSGRRQNPLRLGSWWLRKRTRKKGRGRVRTRTTIGEARYRRREDTG